MAHAEEVQGFERSLITVFSSIAGHRTFDSLFVLCDSIIDMVTNSIWKSIAQSYCSQLLV